jgi:hypothetical protein
MSSLYKPTLTLLKFISCSLILKILLHNFTFFLLKIKPKAFLFLENGTTQELQEWKSKSGGGSCSQEEEELQEGASTQPMHFSRSMNKMET